MALLHAKDIATGASPPQIQELSCLAKIVIMVDLKTKQTKKNTE